MNIGAPLHELDDQHTRRGGKPGSYFYYRPGEVLIIERDRERVARLLGAERDWGADEGDDDRRKQRKVKRVAAPDAPFGVGVYRYSGDRDVAAVLADLRAVRPPVTCDYNYVTARTPMRSHAVSYAEPADVSEITPDLPPESPAEGARPVGVLDTGRPIYGTDFRRYYERRFEPEQRPDVAAMESGGGAVDPLTATYRMFVGHQQPKVLKLARPGNEAVDERVDLERDTMVAPFGRLTHPHAGHGIFVSSIIARNANVGIVAEATMADDSIADLYELLIDLDHAIDEGCELINLSMGFRVAGVPGQDEERSPVLDHAIAAIRDRALIVASAGNDGSDRRAWPAAHERVVAVAATKRDGTPTDWSNFGTWVDACAMGDDVVSHYVFADWDYPDGTAKRFRGAARWSGTSFSAPLVTARIAAKMNADRTTARAAWEALRDAAQPPADDDGQPVAGYGVYIE